MAHKSTLCSGTRLTRFSDYNGSQIKLPKLLLNGNNVCMVGLESSIIDLRRILTFIQLIPGGEGPGTSS